MKIICLFAQQRCHYEGQYAPDLRAAIDEWSHGDNPHYIINEEENLRKDDSIAFWRRITIEVNDAEFDRLFYPPTETLKATVRSTHASKAVLSRSWLFKWDEIKSALADTANDRQ